MHTVVWWSVWGLVIGIGLFGFQEARHHSFQLILSLPLLAGAVAAAVLRIKHEYHEAVQNAKWVGYTALFLGLGSGFLYLKSSAVGPFARGSAHKAFLKATFEMSAPEVERVLGRKLVLQDPDRSFPEGLRDWVLDLFPSPEHRIEERILRDISIYHHACQAKFIFIRGRLGRVMIEFPKVARPQTEILIQRIRGDLEREYKLALTSPGLWVYRKELVETTVGRTFFDVGLEQIQVTLQYLPLAEEQPKPLTVEAQAF